MSEEYREVITSSFLRNIALTYQNGVGAYISEEIFDVITGLGKEAKVYKDVAADAFRAEAKPRGPGGEYPIAETRAVTVPLATVNYAMAKDIPDEFRLQTTAQGNFPLRLDAKAIMYNMDQIMMKKEIDTAALIYATDWNGNGAGGLDAAGNWGNDDPALDTMAVDLQDAAEQILLAGGVLPSDLMLTWPAWKKISISPFWIDQIKFTQTVGRLSTNELAEIIGYRVHVGLGVTNSAKEETTGTAVSNRFIMAPLVDPEKGAAFLYHRPPAPGFDTLSVGYQYRLSVAGTADGIALRKWRRPDNKSDRIGVDCEYDIAAMCLECGVQFKDTAIT